MGGGRGQDAAEVGAGALEVNVAEATRNSKVELVLGTLGDQSLCATPEELLVSVQGDPGATEGAEGKAQEGACVRITVETRVRDGVEHVP